MKYVLLVMTFTLGLCPPLAAAKPAPGSTQVTEPGNVIEKTSWLGEEGLPEEPAVSPGDEVPNLGWVSVLGAEFRGTTNGFKTTSNTNGSLWCATGSSSRVANAQLQIPHGTKITIFRLWGWDGKTTGDVGATLYESCLPELGSASNTSVTALASVTTSGKPDAFTIAQTPSPVPIVDAFVCTYFVEIHFDNCDDLEYLSVAKAYVQFQK